MVSWCLNTRYLESHTEMVHITPMHPRNALIARTTNMTNRQTVAPCIMPLLPLPPRVHYTVCPSKNGAQFHNKYSIEEDLKISLIV